MAKRRHNRPGQSSPSQASRSPTRAPRSAPASAPRSAGVATRPPPASQRGAGQAPRAAPARPAARVGASLLRWPPPEEVIIGVIAFLIVIAVAGGAAYYLTHRGVAGAAASTTSANQSDLLGVPIPDEGRVHVVEGSAINYKHVPPASGPHYPVPKNWGIYTKTIAPGYWVHNLEHGGIVVLYDCPSGCPQIVDQLNQAFKTFPKDKYNEVKLVATPYSGLPDHAQAMAVAWDYQKSYTAFNLQDVLAFYNGHVDRGPEDIP